MPVNYIKNINLTLITSLCLAGVALSACQPASDTANKSAPSTKSSSTQTSPPVTEADQSTANSAAPTTAETPAQTTTAPAASAVNSQPITILALGDSLTEGLGVAETDAYPAQLEAALHKAGYPNVKVVNSGLSGETSTGLVNRVNWALKTNPDITILTVGANDAMRGIEVATIEKNIRSAIKTLQDNGSTVILGGMQIYDNMGNDYVRAFSDMYPRIAKDTGVAFIPFFLDGVAADAKLNQADAIHPTKEGYTIIVENNILPVLEPTLKKVLVNKANNTTSPTAPTASETTS